MTGGRIMRKLTYVLLFVALAGPLAPLTGQTQPQPRALAKLMADKVKNAHKLLEGLALADYDTITRSAQELIQISKTAEWAVRKTPQYELHSDDFRRAAEAILQKAKDKNLDGVALAYGDLTRTCVRCHQYVREVQDARLPNRRPDTVARGGLRERP
jgi:cytochrome c556